MTLNQLSTWLEEYLGHELGVHERFHYSRTEPAPPGTTLVTIGFMPDRPAELVTITGYDFPEGTAPGSVTASVQLRARAKTRAEATRIADTATRHLVNTATLLDRVSRTNLQPIGQDQMGNHEVTANLLIETIERTI